MGLSDILDKIGDKLENLMDEIESAYPENERNNRKIITPVNLLAIPILAALNFATSRDIHHHHPKGLPPPPPTPAPLIATPFPTPPPTPKPTPTAKPKPPALDAGKELNQLIPALEGFAAKQIHNLNQKLNITPAPMPTLKTIRQKSTPKPAPTLRPVPPRRGHAEETNFTKTYAGQSPESKETPQRG